MTEEAETYEPSASRRVVTASDPPWHVLRALVGAPAVLVLLLITYGTDLLSSLPAYPGTVLAFLVIVVVPGLPLQAALLRGSTLGAFDRLVIAVPLGLSVAAVPGLIVLERHSDLHQFEVLHTILATLVCAVALFWWRGGEAKEEQPDSGGAGRFLVAALLMVALGGIVTTPLWSKGNVAGDYDDWTYMAYANDYLTSGEINANEPFLGTDAPVNPRMRSNVWVLLQAEVAKVSGAPVDDVLLEYLRPLLTALVVLATVAFTKALFKNVGIAVLAGCFQIGYALTDLSAHEGMGRNILVRSSEDKMIAAFLIFPVAMIFLLRYVDSRSWRAYIGFTLVVFGLAFVHPVPLVYLAVVIAALGVMRLARDRSVGGIRDLALLLIPVGLASIWPFVQRQLLIDVAPELFGTDASSITFRDEFHTIDVGASFVAGNYHMILHPLMLLAIVLVPFLYYLKRPSIGSYVLVALTAGALVVFFFPLTATPVAEIMTPQTLWKLPWMIPVGPILAAAVYEMLRRGPPVLKSLPLSAILPSVLLVVVLGLGLVMLEYYEAADDGTFYDWRSEESVLPGGERSIFLGGLDRTFTTTWRLSTAERELLTWIQEYSLRNTVILAEPSWINHMIPGVMDDTYPVDFGGQAGEGDRRDGTEAFDNGEMSVSEFESFLARYDVDFVVAREVGPASGVFRDSTRVHFLEEFSPYVVFEFR